MSSTSILSSGESEERWVHAMENNFDQHHHIAIDMPPLCVFRVPKSRSDEKPEAYAPTRLGLGPLHHLRPDLYASTNSHKLAAVTKLLPPEKLHHLRVGVVQALVEMEPVVRACYDQYLDLDIKTLAWILAIDGLYLFHFLKNYPEMEHLAGDVLMLENQIPLVLLDKILQVLQLSPTDDDTSLFRDFKKTSLLRSLLGDFKKTHDRSLLRDFEEFFDDQSPLQLSSVTKCPNYTHLLHRMHYLIVNNRGFITPPSKMAQPPIKKIEKKMAQPQLNDGVLSFVSANPWGKICGMLDEEDSSTSAADEIDIPSVWQMMETAGIRSIRKKDEGDSSTSAADEIDIPSVSQMTETAGIRFIRTEGGIRDVRFDESEKKFYLPSIRITATTEIVLRNLVAYEAAAAAAESGATLELAKYVDLMCGIIDSRRDVEILREAGIVRSEMDEEEIARIFNRISKSEKEKKKKKKKTDELSNVENAVGDVNTIYNSLPLVKFKKAAEKYGNGCFKVARTVITIAVVVLLTLRAYCSLFGCGRGHGRGRWLGNDDVVTLTHHSML